MCRSASSRWPTTSIFPSSISRKIEPAASAYDDLDAEFAGLLTEMNAVEVRRAAGAQRGL